MREGSRLPISGISSAGSPAKRRPLGCRARPAVEEQRLTYRRPDGVGLERLGQQESRLRPRPWQDDLEGCAGKGPREKRAAAVPRLNPPSSAPT